jgi:hypothetical protein
MDISKLIVFVQFWKVLIIVAMFYSLPSIQFVFFQYHTNSGNLDETCYYNFKCKIDFLGISAFNNGKVQDINLFFVNGTDLNFCLLAFCIYFDIVISNIGYIIVGIVFAIVVKVTKPPEDPTRGLHTDMSLYYCMSLTTIFEGSEHELSLLIQTWFYRALEF